MGKNVNADMDYTEIYMGDSSNRDFTYWPSQLGTLVLGQTYEFRVRAHSNKTGYGPYSNTGSLRIPVYQAPTNLNAYWLTDRIILSWNLVEEASGYDVHRATTMSGNYIWLGATTDRSYEDRNVTPGEIYYYKVAAKSDKFQMTELSTACWPSTTGGFAVSGTITSGGVGLSGVTVTAGSASDVTSSDGTYTISGLANGTYTVTPSLSGYTFTPVNRSVTGSNADVTGVNFIAVDLSSTYSISGTITVSSTGLSGVTVMAGSAWAITLENGTYTIYGLANGTYTVTPTLSGYTFSPVNRTVTVSGANVTGKDFSATAVSGAYSISGTITVNSAGLSGVTVTAGSASATTSSGGGLHDYRPGERHLHRLAELLGVHFHPGK